MTDNHVVDHVFVVGTCFVSRAPSVVREFKSALFNKHLNIFLHLFVLAIIPHPEELHLDIGEFPVRVLQELINSRVKDQMDGGVLSILVCSRVILIESLNPAYIIMGMCEEMDVNSFILLISSWDDFAGGAQSLSYVMGPIDLFNL